MEVQSNLVLASASPRRREILSSLGFEFEVIPPDVDESEIFWKDPEKIATLLAELKAVDVLGGKPRKTVIGADTIVVCEGTVMGKPGNREEIVSMLERLSGRSHKVLTGIAIATLPDTRIVEVETTIVRFRELSRGEIEKYADMDEPVDKAGAYAIQGHASVFVERIEGCYLNVVGLPVQRLFKMFRKLENVSSR
ncbi:MAG: septum formation protein Maf [Candidatus Krumholzibacteria bacterium]|nr:septum formation protein Maf [Candidatus Krumholzibacteria bacterium]